MYHLVLLARNLQGYYNLVRLVTQGALSGYYYKPRVDKALLRRHAEGLIALSACLKGEIPYTLVSKGLDAALDLCREYESIFPGAFFLEAQCNGLARQNEVNGKLLELSRLSGLPLVGTNDCHYLRREDAEAHDVLLCIQTQATVGDARRMRMETQELYYKSPEEMAKDFAWAPEALENAGRIAGLCEDYGFKFGEYHFPCYALPEGVSLDEEFRRLARAGLEARLARLVYPADAEAYRARLEMELDVIARMGYQGYFLIVQDFINWGRTHGVPIGPGRGSAAGSLAAWALRITNIDPIPYNLLFERFLNPERVSLPDIDVDFCEHKRKDVLDYVTNRYGADSVSQITTFGTMKARAAVRDVGRALGLSYAETDRVAKLVPAKLDMTIADALEQEPRLKELYGQDPGIRKLIDISRRLEGLCRHASTHAAGVVISDRPMVGYLPLYRGKHDEIVTQYDMKAVEKIGLVKFDFLGLRTMTVIQDTLDLIAAQGLEPPNLEELPLNDPAVYRLYASGDTDGIFQVEGGGLRRYLRRLKPTVFEDIIAMNALYRPGPLDAKGVGGGNMVDDFIDRKHGALKLDYPLPQLEDCLKDTYGVIVYQEQVMRIAQIVAGYTLGGADMLRRAMGKKDAAAMAENRARFLEGAVRNGVSEAKAGEIFDLIEKFARYGFNKSHSAAYALISYHTAYLKTYYKAEFMAALLTSEMGNQEKMLKYIAACKDMGLRVEPPSALESAEDFTVRDGRILFGLGGVRNVGGEAIREILGARNNDGPYLSLLDLCCRVNLRKVSKRVLESLIKSGALDCLGVSRRAMFSSLDVVAAKAQKKHKDALSGQMSMLSLVPCGLPEPGRAGIGLSCPEESLGEWTEEVKLSFEKEALGFFLSSHPLQPFRRDMFRLGLMNLEDAREMTAGSSLKSAVLISGMEEKMTRNGKRMAVCQINDLTGNGECVFFPKSYEKVRESLALDIPLELEAVVLGDRESGAAASGEEDEEEGPRQARLAGETVRPLLEAVRADPSPVELSCGLEVLRPEHVRALKEILERHPGTVEVMLSLYGSGRQCRLQLPAHKVMPGPELEAELVRWESGLDAVAA
jgi:DNA polymerase-3 subunit alpha